MKQAIIAGKIQRKKVYFFTTLLVISALIVGGCARGEMQRDIETDSELSKELAEAFDFDEERAPDQEAKPQETDNNQEDQVLSETQRIGKENYGYVSVPKDWVKFLDLNGAENLVQYSDGAGTSVITLNTWNTSSAEFADMDAESLSNKMWHGMDQQGAQHIDGAMVEIYGHTSYQIYGVYPDRQVVLVVWVFEGEDGYLHYIAVEGSLEKIEDVVAMVENTYSFIE